MQQQQQQPPKFARYKGARQAAANSAANSHASPNVPSRYRRPSQSPNPGASPALSSGSLGLLNPLAQSPPSPVVRATATPPELHSNQNTSRPVHPLSSSTPDQYLPHDVTSGPPAQPAQLWPPIEYSLDMSQRPESEQPNHARYTPQYGIDEWKALERNDSPVQYEKANSNDVSSHSQASDSRQRRARVMSDGEDEGRRFGCFRFRHRRKNSKSPETIAPAPAPSGPDAFIKQGGGGIVPGTDAPKSAVNAGERRVQVFCDNLSMQFPVDLETTPADLLYSAANCFSRPIDPKTVALVEHYSKIGIQRPLRRYEHVRDIVNSWDTENNNRLIIKSAKETGADPSLLHAATVTREQPRECSFDLHYSQRPGKWSQRYITVRSDGQVLCAKKAGDKDSSNVCHLSDFDAYLPTPEALKQKLKPPKEHCIAIKSQQPTNLFESKENFVHFFATADKTTAIRFYVAVQAWRSWYLVNQLGEGGKKPQAQNVSPQRMPSKRTQGHAHKPSATSDESPYRLGSMKPLMDMSRFDADAPQTIDASPVRQRSVRRNPSVKDKQRQPAQPQLAENEPLANIFASAGTSAAPNTVIARSQSLRQARSNQPTRVVSPSADMAGGRPGTSDGQDRQQAPAQSTEDKRRSADLSRSKSKREPPKPLIDLTPEYRPPPQHTRKGRGVKNDNGGLLVDAATTPADPINAPPAVDWRGMNGAAAARQLHSASVNDQPTQSRARSSSTAGRRPSGPDDRTMSMKASQSDEDAFVRGGLVQSLPASGVGQPIGRGVMQGNNAKGPMLDLSEPSQYAPGSLLARQETLPTQQTA